MIFSIRYSSELAKKVAEFSGKKLGNTEIKNFTSGEIYIKILEDVKEDCFIIGSTNTAENIIELLLLANAVKSFKVKFLLIIPYFGYARQNKIFGKGEALSAKVFIDVLKTQRPEKIFAVDLHAPLSGVENIPSIPAFAEHFRKKDVVVVSPDKGGAQRVKELAEMMNKPYFVLEKTREEQQKVSSITGKAEVQGKEVLLFDDMIDTGSTILKAAAYLKQLGAKKINVAATHLILSNDADIKLKEEGIHILGSDTLRHSHETVSMAKVIAEKLKS